MFKEDLREFFDANEMADDAIVGLKTVSGIMESQFIEALGIEGVRPVFTCAEVDVVGLTFKQTIKVKGITYKVAGVQPDGTGLTSLVLEQQ
tara:strand:- start:932 stop:1204 length:273 start_codon:yes stop_codon:yes gene_type:complete